MIMTASAIPSTSQFKVEDAFKGCQQTLLIDSALRRNRNDGKHHLACAVRQRKYSDKAEYIIGKEGDTDGKEQH